MTATAEHPLPEEAGPRHRDRPTGVARLRLALTPARLAVAVVTAACVALVCATYGFFPGQSQVPLMATYSTGMLTCLHDQGLASLTSWCQATGVPVGAPPLTGLPELYLGWALLLLPGTTAWAVNQATGVLVIALGVCGLLAVLRRWSVPWWLAFGAVLSYFLGPNLLQLNGFAHTFDGFILLPAYVWGALRVLDLTERGRWVLASVAGVLLALVIAFMDGYSYFGAAVVTGFLAVALAVRTWHRGHRGRGVAQAGLWLGSLALAAAAYASYVPSTTLETHPPLDFPARHGVDVTSLLVPSSRYWYPELLGFTPPVMDTWGWADAPPTHYLGYLTVAFAVVAVVATLRGRWTVRWEVVGVALGAVATLVLALGPVLKVGQTEPGLDAALLTLPTSLLYEHVPGFTSLRVSNRWMVTARLCCVLLAALGLTAAWRRLRPRHALAGAAVVAAAALTLVEVLPAPARILDERERSMALVQRLEGGIVAEADRLLRDDELVLMLPSSNDFLADFLVPVVGARSYNVGIDKNHAFSAAAWPDAVRAAVAAYREDGPSALDEVCAVLREDADAVVLPTIDTRNGVLLHSNDPEVEAQRRAWALTAAADERFDAAVGDWLVVLRPAAAGPCAPAR